MKHLFLSLSLTVILALALAACGSSDESDMGTGQEDIQPEAQVIEEPQPGVVPTEEVAPEVEAVEPPAAEEPSESAQAEQPAAEESEVIPPTGPANLNSVSDLLESELLNSNNEQIGSVEDIMIDLNTGQTSYLMVSLNNVVPGAEAAPAEGSEAAPAEGSDVAPAEGEEAAPAEGSEVAPADDTMQATTQVVPVPLTAVEWNAEAAQLIYTGSQPLEQAPTIDLEQIGSGDSTWKSEADSFWGFEGQDTQ